MIQSRKQNREREENANYAEKKVENHFKRRVR